MVKFHFVGQNHHSQHSPPSANARHLGGGSSSLSYAQTVCARYRSWPAAAAVGGTPVCLLVVRYGSTVGVNNLASIVSLYQCVASPHMPSVCMCVCATRGCASMHPALDEPSDRYVQFLPIPTIASYKKSNLSATLAARTNKYCNQCNAIKCLIKVVLATAPDVSCARFIVSKNSMTLTMHD